MDPIGTNYRCGKWINSRYLYYKSSECLRCIGISNYYHYTTCPIGHNSIHYSQCIMLWRK